MIETELAIVGGGPAGLSAAIEAARTGVKVVLLDENGKPGGQLFKQIHKFFGSKEHRAGIRGFDIGNMLLNETKKLGVETLLDTKVWGIFKDLSLAISRDGETDIVRSKKILLATGAIETPLSFPGWTLPGVMGAGAAQTLVNLHRVLPGQKFLMVGSGNVGLIVAYQLLQAGAEVKAVIDIAPVIGGYGVHAGKIKRQGVRILPSYTILEAQGKERVERAIIAKIDAKGKPTPGSEEMLDVECICLAVGLNPLAELGWIAGCAFDYKADRGGFFPKHNNRMETKVPGIYVAGDISGIDEASCAMEEGKIAALAVAESLGYLNAAEAKKRIEKRQGNLKTLRSGPFGEARRKRARILMKRGYAIAGAGLDYTGALSLSELKKTPGIPTSRRLQKGPVAFLECNQKIPCNPCEVACPRGAIHVGTPITNLPVLKEEKCTGCGICIPFCPGLAIFVVDQSRKGKEAIIRLPYEFFPFPEVGAEVLALDRHGTVVTKGKVLKVSMGRTHDRTAVVAISVPKEFALGVRSISPRKGDES
jgi:NADPH-dependent 2,4-dienoyl-CoA reductase/sulfur reductase-like enzyme/Fe-S-cluster-containing hydrogenase component 2